jgi:ATP-binding cassette subfamily B protein
VPKSSKSSRQRFTAYIEKRKASSSGQRIHESVDQSAEAKRAAKAKRSFFGLFGAFSQLLHGYRTTIGMAIGTLSIAVLLGLLMPLSTKIAFDYILSDNPGPFGLPDFLSVDGDSSGDRKQLLWILSAAMFVIAASSVAVGIWGRWQCTRITKRVQVGLRKKVFDHASKLPLHRIYQLKSGGVSSVLREDAGSVGELVFSLIYNPWRAVTQLIGTMIILMWIDWVLVVGAVLLLPLIWFTHRTWIHRIRPLYRDIRTRREGIDAMSAEAFSGMRVVRAFSRRQAEAARFTTEGHMLARQELHTWWLARIIELIWEVLIPVASIGVLIYGGSAVIDGRLTIGDLAAFSMYLIYLLGPLESLVGSATSVQNALAALDRVLDLLAEPVEFESTEPTQGIESSMVQGRVTITDLAYHYPRRAGSDSKENPKNDEPGELVLHDVSLEVNPGETIALVGASGAGKTTLCNLIARFDDPVEGSIMLDGIDLREIEIEQYRKLLGIVEQDVFLFDGSVAQNIGYAKRNATQEDIVAAAKAANANRFIVELEEGYNTIIGERGVRLSGGQKQRLAIARAILANPRILILDEATSSLDTESERLIQNSLSKLMKDRTSFVIAHRLSTIRHADRIVVIEQGTILEIGTHDELSEKGGRYAQLLEMQLEGDDSAAAED